MTLTQHWVAHRAARVTPPVLVQLPTQLSIDAAREAAALRVAINRVDALSATDPVNKLVGSVHAAPSVAGATSSTPDTITPHTYAYVGGVIKKSFARTATHAGLSTAQVGKIRTIFGDVVSLDQLKTGDSFHALYQVADARGATAHGTLLVAEIRTAVRTYRAARYVDTKGNAEYYAPDGASLHPGFMRAPLRYTQVSSGFSYRRLDPVLHIYHAHEAVDLAAPYGTPVKATGSGRIHFRGYNGGYGNLVEVDHGHGYLTRYAHLSRFAPALNTGKHVKQNEVIGYVGSTGYSTGAHVHYEFVIAGVRRNPMTVALPKGKPMLARLERLRFAMQAHAWFAKLDMGAAQLKGHGFI